MAMMTWLIGLIKWYITVLFLVKEYILKLIRVMFSTEFVISISKIFCHGLLDCFIIIIVFWVL